MRKSAILIAIFVIISSLVFSLAACSSSDIDEVPSQPSDNNSSGNGATGGTSEENNNPSEGDNATTTQPTDHDHIYEITVLVQPSCGVEGKQVYECVICGKRQHETAIAPLATQHNYQYSSELSIAPTCTVAGKKVEHCYTCGQDKEEVWPATGHKWHTKSSVDSNTNEIIITPYCTRCPLISQYPYKYKVSDVSKLTAGSNGIYGELDYTIIGDRGNATILKSPYYAVYCTAEYLLIARSSKSITGYIPDGAVINGNPLDYYKNRGCSILIETTITITADGRIQFDN